MKKIFRVIVLLLSIEGFAQQGGMWIPSLLMGKNEREMKELGMKISAQDIYNANASSIKDAVPHFNGGCTSEVISPNGLLLTNHHCGYGEIQSHSTLEHNYLQDGFWAKNYAEELPNPDLQVTFIVKIEDVTKQVNQGVSFSMTLEQQNALKIENIKKLQNSYPKENWQEIMVKPIYDANQYLLYVTETFKDVRLVGTPPSSIGKFGSDTDNWVWPRHTGDFSLFRIYANSENKPAEYSEDNVPYKPKHYLPISLNGIKENDFTMVLGYPGRTQEYLPSYAVHHILQSINPARIQLREEALKIADAYMRKDEAIKIQYASKYASIANYWKKWIGESQGLKKSNALEIKKEFEKDFTQRLVKLNKSDDYADVLPSLKELYHQNAAYALAKEYQQEIFRNIELLELCSYFISMEESLNKALESKLSPEKINNLKASILSELKLFYKDFNEKVDRDIFVKLMELYSSGAPQELISEKLFAKNSKDLAKEIYGQSSLVSYDKISELFKKSTKKISKSLAKDKALLFVKSLMDTYKTKVAPTYTKNMTQIKDWQKKYMKAILEMYPDKSFFPDANSTLRVTYGKVNGYQPKDAVTYDYITYLDGVLEKYIPGDYEFDVPQKLIDLYNKKDFGKYAHNNGKLPVNFIATNHTTGGNSGSPALDKKGNLIGLNFDRVWEGTMSDIYYDPSISRNIMVDIRYVLFVIDKYANAKHLIKEMKIVDDAN